jgi:hypothetical protein
MTRPVFVHIGLPKTGTTFLQKRVFTSPKFLNLNNHEPAGANPECEKAFSLLARTICCCEEMRYAEYMAENQAAFSCILSSEEPLLLSGEEFTAEWYLTDRALVANRLHDLFPQAHIILFIRNQIDALKSMYQQASKGFGAKTYSYSFTEYLDAALAVYRQTPLSPQTQARLSSIGDPVGRLRYDLIARHYRNIFGADHVHIFTYEGFFSGQERGQMETLLGIPLQGDFSIVENKRVSGCEYLRNLYAGKRGASYFLRFVFGLMGRTPLAKIVPPTPFAPTAQQEASLKEIFVPANQALQDEFDLPLKALGYPI